MTPRHVVSVDVASRIWDVLVECVGAHEHDRNVFVRYLTDPSMWGHEYRFIGTLGFGGKLHHDSWNGARVTCYPEDLTDDRTAAIEAVNARLAEVCPGNRVGGGTP